MPIRITGMNSGLDTESIIAELVKAEKTKVEKTKKKQTAFGWKQEAWKELNTKIGKLFNRLNNMRFSGDWSRKVTDVSDSSVASVATNSNALNVTQKLRVKSLSTTAYMTSGELKTLARTTCGEVRMNPDDPDDNTLADGSTKLSDLGLTNGANFILVKQGSGGNAEEKEINLGANDTIDDLVTALQNEGLDASFTDGRLSISSKVAGEEGYFTIKAKDAGDDVAAMGRLGISSDGVRNVSGSADVYSTMADFGIQDGSKFKVTVGGSEHTIELSSNTNFWNLQTELSKLGLEASFDRANRRFHISSGTAGAAGDFSIKVEDLGGNDVSDKLGLAVDNSGDKDNPDPAKAQKIAGTDAEILLNGVSYKSSGNTFSVNGMTITAKEVSDKEVTLTTRRDTEGIYERVKKFLQEYNELIKEMDTLYNADSSKGYDPLTDEEKDAMTEKEIEKWEAKIKDSILRRDSNLNTISTSLKELMLKGATVNGQQMYLANFGIETLGYYEAEENERNVYQILGDSDFTDPSSRMGDTSNTLQEKIAEDPDMVIEFFSQLTMNLYQELDKQSRSIDQIRSFGKFYDDKLMETEYKEYTSKIEKQEAKLTALEDKWYKKFSAMETALAKMQSNQNALSSLLGG